MISCSLLLGIPHLKEGEDVNEHIKEENHLSEHLMATGHADDPFELQKTALDVIGQDNIDSLMSAVQKINTNAQEDMPSPPKLSF